MKMKIFFWFCASMAILNLACGVIGLFIGLKWYYLLINFGVGIVLAGQAFQFYQFKLEAEIREIMWRERLKRLEGDE